MPYTVRYMLVSRCFYDSVMSESSIRVDPSFVVYARLEIAAGLWRLGGEDESRESLPRVRFRLCKEDRRFLETVSCMTCLSIRGSFLGLPFAPKDVKRFLCACIALVFLSTLVAS